VGSPTCQAICSHALLHFSVEPEGRVEVSGRSNVLQALFRIVNNDSEETQATVAKAVCNLLSQDDSRANTLVAGGITVSSIYFRYVYIYFSACFFINNIILQPFLL
jgi:hypothetical protein